MEKIYHQIRKIVYQKEQACNNHHLDCLIIFIVLYKSIFQSKWNNISVICTTVLLSHWWLHHLLLYISNRSMYVIYSIDNKQYNCIFTDYIINCKFKNYKLDRWKMSLLSFIWQEEIKFTLLLPCTWTDISISLVFFRLEFTLF